MTCHRGGNSFTFAQSEKVLSLVSSSPMRNSGEFPVSGYRDDNGDGAVVVVVLTILTLVWSSPMRNTCVFSASGYRGAGGEW